MISKCIVSTFSILTILGGLAIISVGYWLILSADSLIGDATTSGETISLGDVAKRITIVAAIIGGVAILFGILGILVAQIQKSACICLFGFLSLLITVILSISSYAMIQLYMIEPVEI